MTWEISQDLYYTQVDSLIRDKLGVAVPYPAIWHCRRRNLTRTSEAIGWYNSAL